MAGSLADFKYFDDFGRAWLLRLDKSNAIAAGFSPITNADLTLDYLPRNISPRYITAKHPTRPITRDIYVPATNSPIWTSSQTTITLTDYQDRSLQSFSVKDRHREKAIYSPKVTDTYQNDSP